MLGGAPGQTPELALDRALRRLRVEELAVYMQTRAQAIQIDGDELFDYSVDRLLEGLAADLAAHPARRARRGT